MQTQPVSTTLDELAAESGWLRRLARSLVKDPAAADDLVQDAYVLAAEQPPGGDRPLRPWLVRVLVNLTRTRRRSAARRSAREHAVAALAGAPATPAELVGRVELHRLLAGLVLELSPAARDVVLLHYFEGLSLVAIGSRLGVAAGTVRWRLKQALGELRDRLDHREPNRAWIPALAAFGAPGRTAGGAVAWLVVAAIALLLASVWLVVHARPAIHEPSLGGEAARRRAARQAAHHDQASAELDGSAAPSTLPPLPAGQTRLEGRVVDAQQQPVEGADVVIDCGFEDEPAALPRTRSNARGWFAFDVDPGCQAGVLATKGELAGSGHLFPVPADQNVLVLVLRPQLAVVVRAVDDATGAPIAGAEVEGITWPATIDPSTAVTGADGRAKLQIVQNERPPFTVYVTASGAEHVFRSLQFKVEDVPRGTAPIERTIRLPRGLSIRGQVVTPDGKPPRGLRLHVFEPGKPELTVRYPVYKLPPDGDRVDAEGRFTIAVLGAGSYELAPQGTRFVARDRSEARFHVGAEGLAGIVLHLAVAPVSVTGIVVDAAGTPVSGARVSAPLWQLSPFMSVITDARGRFETRHRGPTLELVARLGDQASETTQVQVRPDQPSHVTLTLGPAGIAGVVVDPDGLPVPDAQVWLNSCCGERRVVTGTRVIADASGRFAFDVPRGNFVLSVRRTADDDFLDEDDRQVAGGTHHLRLVVP
jgi:RNA polymerase sigma-70 factor (ECF subfamily)